MAGCWFLHIFPHLWISLLSENQASGFICKQLNSQQFTEPCRAECIGKMINNYIDLLTPVNPGLSEKKKTGN